MLVLCCHGSAIWNGPLPMGMSLYSALSASPAVDGTGLITVCVVLVSNSQSGAAMETINVLSSGADNPENVVAVPACSSAKPAIPAM